jgi:hypothetical protein
LHAFIPITDLFAAICASVADFRTRAVNAEANC